MKTFVFAIYLGFKKDDLVEIKVRAENIKTATTKVKNILYNYIDTQVTGLYLNDEY